MPAGGFGNNSGPGGDSFGGDNSGGNGGGGGGDYGISDYDGPVDSSPYGSHTETESVSADMGLGSYGGYGGGGGIPDFSVPNTPVAPAPSFNYGMPNFSVPNQAPPNPMGTYGWAPSTFQGHTQPVDAMAQMYDMGYNSKAAVGQHMEQGNYGKAAGHFGLGLVDDALGYLGGFLGGNLGGALGGTLGFALGGPTGGLLGALGGSMGLGAAGKSMGQTLGTNMAADIALGKPAGAYADPTGFGMDDGMGGGGGEGEPLNYAQLAAGGLMPDAVNVPTVAAVRSPTLTSPYYDYGYDKSPYEINPHLQRQMNEYARRYGVHS